MSWRDQALTQSHGDTPAPCTWDPVRGKCALSSLGVGFGHSGSRHFKS